MLQKSLLAKTFGIQNPVFYQKTIKAYLNYQADIETHIYVYIRNVMVLLSSLQQMSLLTQKAILLCFKRPIIMLLHQNIYFYFLDIKNNIRK